MFVPYHHMSRQPRHLANIFSASRTSRLEARPYHSHHINLFEASLLSGLPTPLCGPATSWRSCLTRYATPGQMTSVWGYPTDGTDVPRAATKNARSRGNI